MAQQYSGSEIAPALAGIVLAAGYSSRMGELKALKRLGPATLLEHAVSALQSIGPAPVVVVTGHEAHLLENTIEELGGTQVHNSSFASGMFSSVQSGVKALMRYPWEHIHGPENPSMPDFLLLPVDAAPVRPASIVMLAQAWRDIFKRYGRAISNRSILIPVFAGRTGHPPVIGKGHAKAIATYAGEDGLRGYIASLLEDESAAEFMEGRMPAASKRVEDCTGGDYPFPLVAVPAKDAGNPVFFLQLPDACIVSDVDTPEDFAAAETHFDATRNLSRPTPEEAWQWLRISGLSEEKIRHSLKVAQGALRLAIAMGHTGHSLEEELVFNAALVHDVARACMAGPRKCKDHARKGAELCLAMGWQDMAFIVGAHTVLPDALLQRYHVPLKDVPVRCSQKHDCEPGKNGMPLPLLYRQIGDGHCREIDLGPLYADIPQPLADACLCVYLADKFFFMDSLVSIEQRYGQVKERFATDGPAFEAISQRERVALAIQDLMREKTGHDPLELMRGASGHPLDSLAEHYLLGAL